MTDRPPAPTPPAGARLRAAATALLAAWMGERFFRTFRPAPPAEAGAFDSALLQRERRIGVTVQPLWGDAPTSGAAELERLVDTPPGAYALWVPPAADLPTTEPALSDLRDRVERALGGLDPAERREFRLPVQVRLAQLEGDGAYVSVAGGLSPHWLQISDGVRGSYHLDAREIRRLPEQEAELEILLSRVRDVAAALEPGEVTAFELHDYWLVSRIPGDAPQGLTVVGAPADFAPDAGATVRSSLRGGIVRAREARAADPDCAMSALVVIAPLGHLREERVTAALRGMSPAAYSGLDLIVVVADGLVQQVLRPRSLPWEQDAQARHGEAAAGADAD